jgi:hypothetical protein
MKLTPQTTPSGIALILVLIVMTVLGVLAGGLAIAMKVETQLSRNASHDSTMEWLGRSGIELAKWVLAEEKKGSRFANVDSLRDIALGGPGETNSPLMGFSMKNIPLPPGSISVEIQDAERKFNINRADPLILREALGKVVGVEGTEVANIVDSIMDWRDVDNNPGMNGTESDTYLNYRPPYRAKNGPLDDMSELLRVRGIKANPGIYWGSSNDTAQARSRYRLPRRMGGTGEELDYAVGLVSLFTAISSGQINVNTTSAEQLKIFPGIDDQTAEMILRQRKGPDGVDGTEDDEPIPDVRFLLAPAGAPGAQGATPVDPGILGPWIPYLTVRSTVFEVHVTAKIDSDTRTYYGLLRRRGPRDFELIRFYWKLGASGS